MNNTAMTNQQNLWTVYLTCPAFPGKLRTSTVQADNLAKAKSIALSMYPGYSLLDC
jgi:hypothetical protein